MQTALDALEESLDSVRYVTLDIDANATAALGDAVILARHNAIQAAITVIISGFLESFLKGIAESFTTLVCGTGVAFTLLPPKLQAAHYIQGGSVLSNKAAGKAKFSWVTASPVDLARRLESVQSSTPYEIVWEAFADTQSNPNVGVIGNFLSQFGVQDGWDKLEVKAGLSKQSMQTQIESLLAVRNECAHTGKASVVPSPSQIRTYCDGISVLAVAIVSVLNDHLATL
jgi:hypothetical protein